MKFISLLKNNVHSIIFAVTNTTLIAGVFFSPEVYAYMDYVWYPDGGTQSLNYSLVKTVSDPEKNKTGEIPLLREPFTISGNYYATCYSKCTLSSTVIFTAKVPNLTFVTTRDNLSYYKVTDNLAVATEINTRTSQSTLINMPVPYTDVNNNTTINDTVTHKQFTTGTKGTISIMILKPFIGKNDIPLTTIAQLSATSNASYHDASAILSEIKLVGTITATQSCDFTTGKTLNINFGSIMLPDVVSKGPVAGKEQVIDLNIKCTNVSSGVAVKMKMSGDTDTNNSQYLKTTNPDIGIALSEHDTKLPISPAGGIFPQSGSIIKDYTDYTSQMGYMKIDAVPANSSGNKPAQGDFTATATVTIELQ